MSHEKSPHRWDVKFSRSAEKQYERLKRNGSKPSAADLVNLLIIELRIDGPYRSNWSNYGQLQENDFHCHLKKGRPTYVACWRIVNKIDKRVEVFYVGSHENSPY